MLHKIIFYRVYHCIAFLHKSSFSRDKNSDVIEILAWTPPLSCP